MGYTGVVDLEERMRAAGERYVKSRGETDAARAEVRALALEAIAAEFSRHSIAELLGVDRMTVRKWVGKR
jgi:hypothetical protein